MEIVPKYQNSGIIAQRDNTNVKVGNPFDKLNQSVPHVPRQTYLSPDNRADWQRAQSQKAAKTDYANYKHDQNVAKSMQTLGAFLELTDNVTLVTGVGGLAGKGLATAGRAALKKGVIGRLRDTNRAKSAFQEYISPFGYQLFNNYDGKIPEVARFIKGYVVQGKDAPKFPWHVKRMAIEPERTVNRQEALRLYMGNPKPTDNLYLRNADGTYRYNPSRIPKENIDYQRQVFQEAGNGKPAQEYLTTTLNGPKGTRPGNAGGVTSTIDSKGNFIIDDTWDLNPLKRFKWLPKPIRNFEAGKLIGAKPFRVYDDQIGKVYKSELNWNNWSKGGDISKAHLSEYADIERKSKQAGTWLKNPDGTDFVGDPRSWVQMQSKDFNKWFNNSPLKEATGTPTTFYHGSPSNTITEFRKPSHPDYVKGKGRGTGEEGIYVTPNKSYAERYKSPDLMRGGNTSNSTVYELWSNANPVEFNAKNFPTSDVSTFYKTSKADRALVESKGHNAMSLGKMLNNSNGKRPELNVFEPTQLKSVIGNNGDFNRLNSNIYKVVIPTVLGSKLSNEL